MKSLTTAVAVLLMSQTANAQYRPSYQPVLDVLYDYDLWAGPATVYYLVVTVDGKEERYGPHKTYNDATGQLFFYYEHGLLPEGAETRIDEAQELIKVARFDRRADARQAEDMLIRLGLQTEIRAVRVANFTLKPAIDLPPLRRIGG